MDEHHNQAGSLENKTDFSSCSHRQIRLWRAHMEWIWEERCHFYDPAFLNAVLALQTK